MERLVYDRHRARDLSGLTWQRIPWNPPRWRKTDTYAYASKCQQACKRIVEQPKNTTH